MGESSVNRYKVELSDLDGRELRSISRTELGEKGNKLYADYSFHTDVPQLQSPDHPHNRIYLDGACAGPYMDAKRGIWSLDHHSGCIRQFTLATCMQAVTLTRRRVIEAMGYKIVEDEPDLDSRLAAWALLNADSIAYDDRVYKRILPVFQLAGNIDAYAFGAEDLTGLTSDQIDEVRSKINGLMSKEYKVKKDGRWRSIDYIEFVVSSLHDIDRLAFHKSSFEAPIRVDVNQKETLKNGQTVSYVRLPSTGIYEVEKELIKNSNVACIILNDGRSKWTIKLAGLVSRFNLAPVWNALNEAETAEKKHRGVTDEVIFKAGWGGADNIGGAPRYPNGQRPFMDESTIIEIVFRVLNSQVETIE